MKQKHLSFDERLEIEKGLKNNLSFKQIGSSIGKDCTTISKEIRNHYKVKNNGAYGRSFNDCTNRKNCPGRIRGTACNSTTCGNYQKEVCNKLLKHPYVCNGCNELSKCTLTKHIYDATYAYKEYKDNLSEARTGINFTESELKNLDAILIPLIKEQGQSVHHAYINNVDTIMCSEKEIYNLIDSGCLTVRNIDLPRKVKYRSRPKKKTYYKIDKKCLEGRRYEYFEKYIEEHPDVNVVEMDTVEGIKGGKVLLTLHFVNCSFMLAFIRDHNDSQSVIDIFNKLEQILGIEKFKELFVIILTDNGSEFTNPSKIEISPYCNEQRTKVFYCEPGRSDQKGACEVNHEFIRRVKPQKTSFNELEQSDINLLMSHINSYKRKKLNDCSPIQLFSMMYGTDTAILLGITEIEPNKINLSPELLKK